MSSSVTDRAQSNPEQINPIEQVDTNKELQLSPNSPKNDVEVEVGEPPKKIVVMPSDIRPHAKAPPRKTVSKRRKTSMILTSSPTKNALCMEMEERMTKKEEAEKRKQARQEKKMQKLVDVKVKAAKKEDQQMKSAETEILEADRPNDKKKAKLQNKK